MGELGSALGRGGRGRGGGPPPHHPSHCYNILNLKQLIQYGTVDHLLAQKAVEL